MLSLIVFATFVIKLCRVPPRIAAEREAELEALRPGPDAPRISLVVAAQYMVEESTWSLRLKPDDDNFLQIATIDLKDKLQQGGLGARGRHMRANGRNYERGFEDIPSGFWPGAELQLFDMLHREVPPPTVTNDATVWADVTVLERAVRTAWPPRSSAQALANRYIEAGRTWRLSPSVPESKPPSEA